MRLGLPGAGEGCSKLHSVAVLQGESGGEQRRRLRTKALMRDLETRPECRQRVLCENWKNIVEVNQ